jgi:hypothetical protein
MQSASSGGIGEGSGESTPDVSPHTSGLYPHGGKHPGRRSISIPRDSRLAASPLRVPDDRGKMGSPHDRPLRQQCLQADPMFLQLGRFRQPRRSRRSIPIALLKRVVKKLETSKGTFILVSFLWEAQTWLASLLTLKVLEVRRLPFMEDLLMDLTMGKPPQSFTTFI